MSNYKTFFENTIIDNIDLESYGLSNDVYLYDKIKTTYNIFKQEYGHMIERVGEGNAFKEWLQGLPSVLTVPFYNCEILENAKNADFFNVTSITIYPDNTRTEEIVLAEGRSLLRKQEKFLDAYWSELSVAFFNLKDNL